MDDMFSIPVVWNSLVSISEHEQTNWKPKKPNMGTIEYILLNLGHMGEFDAQIFLILGFVPVSLHQIFTLQCTLYGCNINLRVNCFFPEEEVDFKCNVVISDIHNGDGFRDHLRQNL